jgi:hypothetical protein
MTWPTAFVILGGIIAGILGVIKIVNMIWGGDIRQACIDRFAEIADTGELRREDCMERFKRMADQIQTNLMQTASLHIDMGKMQTEVAGLNEKIDELKSDFKDLTKFIRDNLRQHK